MIILNRKEFLQMPQGTVFCDGGQWYFRNTKIKGKTTYNDSGIGFDFYYQSLNDIECFGSDDWLTKLDNMITNRTSVPVNTYEERDGSYNEDDIYLIYEKDDLHYLISILTKCLNNLE